jgi:hypothetical protein
MTIREELKGPEEFGTEKKFHRTQTPLTSAFSISDYKIPVMKVEMEVNIIDTRRRICYKIHGGY